MLISGILISNSSTKEKATVLFEAFESESKLLNVDEVKCMLSLCFDASVNNLPLLAIGTSKLTGEGIRSYLDKISPLKAHFVKTISDIIMKNETEIGQKRFCEIFEVEISKYLTSSGIRSFKTNQYS